MSGSCAAGFYCPAGSTTASPSTFFCVQGNKCPAGSAVQIPCDFSEYQDVEKQDSCIQCPAASYCTATAKKDCMKGYYCEVDNKQIPCPVGTYNDGTGESLVGGCTECPAGYSCEEVGQTDYKKTKCGAGYYCEKGTITR